ncbi:MAG: sigma-54-dependent Fis family transcriptional regulator [Bdellovibrio sp.]|nr:MAG: sigma-54-dependent Fis family transcriptional regulator [Bdellovibrio sp.]
MSTIPIMHVIDDDPETLELIRAFFRPKGFEVKAYESAEQALKDLTLPEAHSDVILTDFMLPQMSGMDLTKEIRARGIDTPIVIMTAYQDSQLALDVIRAGAYDFVIKPLHLPQLQISIERAVYLKHVREENALLKEAVAHKEAVLVEGIIGKSPNFLRALDLAKRVANSSASVLITGESGTGKEVIATAIHRFGPRKKHRMVAINCTAIPETLLESELFGHGKGAFTGASEKKVGLFEEANNGTLFLDEIGDLSLSLQAKLLRVLQEKKIRRVGETQPIDVDVRIVSATHKNLKEEISAGRFREDLFFRLNVIPINLPPLRERSEDILPLARYFMRKYAQQNSVRVNEFTKEATEYLLKNHWAGNVRELENTIERAVVLAQGGPVDAKDLIFEETAGVGTPATTMSHEIQAQDLFCISERKIVPLETVINSYIVYALKKNHGAKDRTARDLAIDRKTLYRRIKNREHLSAVPSGNAVAVVAEKNGSLCGGADGTDGTDLGPPSSAAS